MYVPHKLRLGEPRGIRDVTAAVFFMMLECLRVSDWRGSPRSGPAVVSSTSDSRESWTAGMEIPDRDGAIVLSDLWPRKGRTFLQRIATGIRLESPDPQHA
jgi:hypothetical protein